MKKKRKKIFPPLKARAWLIGLSLAGLVFMLFARISAAAVKMPSATAFDRAMYWVWCIAAGAALVAFFVMLRHWRCPACGRGIPLRSSFGMEYCPFCGEGLYRGDEYYPDDQPDEE